MPLDFFLNWVKGLKATLPKFCRVLPGIAGLAKDQIDYLLKVSVIVL